jgi:hexosaminidase
MAVDAPPGRGGVVSTRDIYAFDPLPDTLVDNRDLVLGLQGNLWTEHIRTEERVAYMTWPRAAAIAELGWSTPANRDWGTFEMRLKVHQTRLRNLGIHTGEYVATAVNVDSNRREDRELELCSNVIVLALEDDAPLQGERESFLVAINNPCWIWRNADLTSVQSFSAAVGQLPFNFEIGDDINHVVVEKPETADGELNVRLGSCDGPLIGKLPLAPAVDNPAVTVLHGSKLLMDDKIPVHSDLCFSFTRPGIEPMWVIDWVQVNRSDG